jgi:pimeloyl-ACP methyl ester carboxylesterase
MNPHLLKESFFLSAIGSLLAIAPGCSSQRDAEAGGDEAAVTSGSAFEEVECTSFAPTKALGVDPSTLGPTRCGFMNVPESRGQRSGGKIRLPVFVAKATSPKENAAPLLMLNGGPGGSSVSFLAGFANQGSNAGGLNALRRDRDVVLVNERGVQFSEPQLRCTELDALAADVLGADGHIHEITSDKKLPAIAACYKRWTSAGVDLGSYNVFEMASDVHDTMAALGYAAYDIYGVSFGSMFAQQVAKRFPNEVKAVILDSPVALDGNLIVDVTGSGGSSDKALRTLFEACAGDPTCATKHPDLRATLLTDVAELNAKPAPYFIPHPTDSTKAPFAWQITGDLVVGNIIANMAPGAIGTFPALIDGLKSDGPARDAVLKRIGDFASGGVIPGKDDNRAMNLSVVCSGWGFVSPDGLSDGGDPLLRNITALGKQQLAECTKWPVPKVRDTWKQVDAALVSTTLPALILPAKFDANTPPETGTKIARHLNHAFVHMWPDRGHAMMDFTCASTVINAFLNDPSRDPDASCIESLTIDWQ